MAGHGEENQGEITVTHENENGGQITITLDGEDFVISASRTKPRPLVERAEDYIGTVASAAWHHPTDVTIPIFLAPVLAGVFNPVAPQAQRNAQAVMRLALAGISPFRDRENLRLALQMLLVYQQADLRGRMLLSTAVRFGTGATFSSWLFTLGGRLKKGGAAGWAGRALALFLMASVGSIYRLSLNAYQQGRSVDDMGVYPFLSAIITGEDRVFNLPQEIGIDTYFKLRNYLRENPEAIQLQDTELQLMQSAINGFFDFISDPRGFVSRNAN